MKEAQWKVAPALVFNVYLYRHCIDDADAFANVFKIYRQLTDDAYYGSVVGERGGEKTTSSGRPALKF
eukprot:8737770-Pyramimonas_sp.AAC.1